MKNQCIFLVSNMNLRQSNMSKVTLYISLAASKRHKADRDSECSDFLLHFHSGGRYLRAVDIDHNRLGAVKRYFYFASLSFNERSARMVWAYLTRTVIGIIVVQLCLVLLKLS